MRIISSPTRLSVTWLSVTCIQRKIPHGFCDATSTVDVNVFHPTWKLAPLSPCRCRRHATPSLASHDTDDAFLSHKTARVAISRGSSCDLTEWRVSSPAVDRLSIYSHRRRLLEMTVGARFQGVHPAPRRHRVNSSPPFPSFPFPSSSPSPFFSLPSHFSFLFFLRIN